ncbi:Calcium-transporting P-type ATPase, N-terminal autoinhibitory domain [Dillenia turbinata]|uniref:Calcium-transporting P-type ATPase, N-terminal autoinhibitory domain n=1 Tax=Dillenia turbinata TaxID=194707 RepID=A0AAN8ZJS8_9MAGN
MERYLRENFEIKSKNSSEEELRRWRSAVSIVNNPRRRFRMVADLAKRAESERKRKKIQIFGLWDRRINTSVDSFLVFLVLGKLLGLVCWARN